jgi:hypothetical protein
VVEGAQLFLLLQHRSRLIGTIDAGQEPTPGACDRFEHGGKAEGLAGPERGCDVEGEQRAGCGDSRCLKRQTVLGFVVAEPDRLGIVQGRNAPALQRAQGIAGPRVGDTAVEDDVEIEPAAGSMGRRQVEHKIAIENRRDVDPAIAGRGEDQLLLGTQVGDEHPEPGGMG